MVNTAGPGGSGIVPIPSNLSEIAGGGPKGATLIQYGPCVRQSEIDLTLWVCRFKPWDRMRHDGIRPDEGKMS